MDAMTSHIMIDIETAGTKPGCVVLSIGAAEFVPLTGDILGTFYTTINFKDSVTRGLVVDPSTWTWWQDQDAEVRKEAFGGERMLPDAMIEFEVWVRDRKHVKNFWSQGSDFDFPILQAAYWDTSPARFPIPYYQRRDTRSLYAVAADIAGVDTELFRKRGDDYHNALGDVKHQIRCVHECYRALASAAQNKTDEIEEL